MSNIAPIQMPQLAPVEGAKPKVDVGEVFGNVLHQAQQAEQTAATQSEKFANGDPSVGIHEVMIASEEANIAVRYVTTLKNKALEAYRELMNTQV